MSGAIKKIKLIKSMAVFQDFNWDVSIRDSGNNIAEFKRINIIYGRNYSGKTTLSRIIRALETGIVSNKYENPEFVVNLEEDCNITRTSLLTHGQIIRVFNEDFVKENLHFIIDDEQSINAFAILGDENNRLEEEIKIRELELGFEEMASGLYGKLKNATITFDSAKQCYDVANNNLEIKLTDKANKTGTGIKHDKIFGDANYNVLKIKKDINEVTSDTYKPLNDEEVTRLFQLLKEEAKPTIQESTAFNLKFDFFALRTKELVEKKISVSEPIQDLLNDAVLQAWVRDGRLLHESKRNTCAFCGNQLPNDLWDKLEKHFNKESEQLRDDINQLSKQIQSEKTRIPALLIIRTSDFYSNYSSEIDELKTSFETTVNDYCISLQSLIDILEQRKNDIFTSFVFSEPNNFSHALNEIQNKYESLRIQSNNFTNSLSSMQIKARNALRLHEVYSFVADINYSTEWKTIEHLKQNLENAKKEQSAAEEQIIPKKQAIAELKAQLKDESKGAERVNELLNNFFGHKSISLKAVEIRDNGEKIGYRFEITRNNKKAYHLSEGECSLISLCYFIAKLDDVETKGNQPIIWIDDPISSLDANHIFFAYSLINSEIVKKDKLKQLFVSTHNLDFLKYLKRLPGALNKNSSQYFIIQRNGESSSIQLMPNYLKEYVTEFNFLFHQIYKCAKADIMNDNNYDCYYNFGNNARKFLEAFLYYKYPNAKENDGKLERFFGDDALASSLTDRVNNEYSHLAGIFERSVMPVDIPEMKTAAEFILKKIKEKDIDQYNALLQSIGEEQKESKI